MTHAIQCRREDLTPAELDSLTGLFTRPRPDMAFSFDDLQDAKKMQSTTGCGMTREDAHLAATVAITIIFGIIVGAVVAIVLSGLLTVDAMAPTAAEVMAADFSLEHKLAEAAP
jgi:hypothetical protein